MILPILSMMRMLYEGIYHGICTLYYNNTAQCLVMLMSSYL